jgi:hypothetical protein
MNLSHLFFKFYEPSEINKYKLRKIKISKSRNHKRIHKWANPSIFFFVCIYGNKNAAEWPYVLRVNFVRATGWPSEFIFGSWPDATCNVN